MDELQATSKNRLVDTEEEKQFFQDVLSILENAKKQAYMTSNAIMTYTYWAVGERIYEQEQKGQERAKYGSYLIKRLVLQLLI